MSSLRLGIFCNFGPPSVGGSENVIKHISERLAIDYDYKVNIYSYNNNSCNKGYGLISQINENDHILIYSDSFWGFDTILRHIDRINCRVSLALVGAYAMRNDVHILKLLKENIDRFNLITHSVITEDYKWCVDNDLPVTVIPNGVNLSEFNDNIINFRQKYNIKEKYIILNISNWFFGKGQEAIPKICKKLNSNLKDFIILQCSNAVQYPYDKTFLNRTKRQSAGLNIKFLRDLPREDIVSAFKCADLFLMTSKKEVAPLVILECKAAKLPYISMNVGNTGENAGGIVIENSEEDYKGYKVINDIIINRYIINITNILEDNNLKNKLITEGQKEIDKIDWKNMVSLYHEVFSK